MNNDLISREALKEQFSEIVGEYIVSEIISIIDNTPTVVCEEREQGKCPYYAG